MTDIRPRETFETVIIDNHIAHGPSDIIVHSAIENEQVLKIADVVIITASTLVNNTFEDLLKFTGNARLVGLYGPGASLIPDEFFDRNIDFITSFHITDPVRFSDDMINDHDMESSIRTYAKTVHVHAPSGKDRRNSDPENPAEDCTTVNRYFHDSLKNAIIVRMITEITVTGSFPQSRNRWRRIVLNTLIHAIHGAIFA